ncbi:MAG: hypothetical protein IJZ80_10545 [Clostridia bacterium]|nr:hypothetical protein [Clostridia bacterium]
MKKLLSILLCVVFVLTTAAVWVGAEAATTTEADRIAAASKWDGTPLTVTSDAEVYTFEGLGTAASPYLIQSAEDLAKLSANVRYESYTTNYANKHFKLTCDVDFQNHGWYGIGGVETDTTNLWRDNKKRFEGTFDGDNHVIYNFNLVSEIDSKPVYVNGLFGHAGEGAVIKNIGIASGNVTLKNTNRVGALLGVSRYKLTIENCFNKANFNYTIDSGNNGYAEFRVGGLIGAVMNKDTSVHTFKNCYNTGNITVDAQVDVNICIGGLMGYLADGTNIIENCHNTGNITLTTVRTQLPPNSATDSRPRHFDNSVASLIGTYAFPGTMSVSGCSVDGTITYNSAAPTAETLVIGKMIGYTSGQIVFDNTCKVGVEVVPADNTAYQEVVAKGQSTQPTVDTTSAITIPVAEGELYFIVAMENETPAPGGNETPGDNETPGGDNGGNNDETAAPETNAPETNAPETNAPANEEKSGCGSVVGIGAVAVLAIVGAACTMRKKED